MKFVAPRAVTLWGVSSESFNDIRVVRWMGGWRAIYVTLFSFQEVFLIKSLLSCNELRQKGVIDHSYFVVFVLFGE
jgi:hypothetical protein